MRVGDNLPELLVEITHRDLIRYAGAANDYLPQHWDRDMMRGDGFADVVVHGWLGCAHLCRAATAVFAPDRWVLDRYAVRYRRPLHPGPVVCGGRLVACDGETREVSGWIRDAGGATVTTASMWFAARTGGC